jgi:CysZ protein
MEVVKNFLLSLKMIKEDRVLLLLSLIPVFIGLIFYGLLGGWIFTSVIPYGNEIVQGWLSIDWLGSILGWVFKALISLLFFFAVNWTFFLIVSLLASPFNDLISARVEKKLNNESTVGFGEEFTGFFRKIRFTLINEVKKFFLITILSIVSLTLSFFPLLSPVTIFLQATLVAINFLDYSWSRHNLSFGGCISDYRRNFFNNSIGGFIGGILLALPGVNIVCLPILVVFFSLSFKKPI